MRVTARRVSRCVHSCRTVEAEGDSLLGIDALRALETRQNSRQKKPGLWAPEQQRQEENGDAAASPHTYRKDRPPNFTRVRKFFRFACEARYTTSREALTASASRRFRSAGRSSQIAREDPSFSKKLTARAAPWRADRFRRGGSARGPLPCCCRRSAGSRPCP